MRPKFMDRIEEIAKEKVNTFYAQFKDENNSPAVLLYPSPRPLLGNYMSVNKGRILAASFKMDNIVIIRKNESDVSRFTYNGMMEKDDFHDLNGRQDEFYTFKGLIRGILAKIYVDKNVIIPHFDLLVHKRDGLIDDLLAYMIVDCLNRVFLSDELKKDDILSIVDYACSKYAIIGCDTYLLNAIDAKSLFILDYSKKRDDAIIPLIYDMHDFELFMLLANHHYLDSSLIPHQKMLEVAKYFDKNNLSELSFNDFVFSLSEKKMDYTLVLAAEHYFDETKNLNELTKELAKGSIKPFIDAFKSSALTSARYLGVVRPDSYVSFILNYLNSLPSSACSIIGDDKAGYLISISHRGQNKDVLDYLERYVKEQYLFLDIDKEGIVKLLYDDKEPITTKEEEHKISHDELLRAYKIERKKQRKRFSFLEEID